jgi:Na+/H+ antiporter NhaD/arsenite permease-like protein
MPHVDTWAGPAILIVFLVAYALVFAEEKLHLRKSKPTMVAAGVIWILVALAFHHEGRQAEVVARLRVVLLEYAELLLFLLSAMSFVNAMVERNLFDALRARLTGMNLTVRGVFWVTGTIAFFLSPVADNLTTALVMGTVAIASLQHHKKAVVGTLVSIVVAANAGGAFSPFGDITTLMIWQHGELQFTQFFDLFLPSLLSWLIPAAIISVTLRGRLAEGGQPRTAVRKGGWLIAGLFLLTIAGTVVLDHMLHLPPFLGMMMGLGLLNLYSYFLHRAETRMLEREDTSSLPFEGEEAVGRRPFSIFNILEKIEWDTLLFFYGIMLSIGGLAAVGYLDGMSRFLYQDLGSTIGNTLIGFMSAVVDNIPLTFAVLTMKPQMDTGQWLLLTLAAGIGGSLLSIGSAAGVALMGVGRNTYTFLSHLKWAWAILLGYGAGIAVHLLLNARLFTK